MRLSLYAITLFALFLSACAPIGDRANQPEAGVPAAQAQSEETILAAEPEAQLSGGDSAGELQLDAADLTRVDEQGAVTVEVTAATLTGPVETLSFAVAMNTHSVDLNMDLAQQAVLTTDTGLSVRPLSWDGMSGGHHVSGNLVFPAQVDGQSLLDGATSLKLVIQGVDVPERTFTWTIGS